jgi:hypothetical protein
MKPEHPFGEAFRARLPFAQTFQVLGEGTAR